MLNNQKVIFVSILDKLSKSFLDFESRIWHQEELIQKFLYSEMCVMGRLTHESTQWKGNNTWVLSNKPDWIRQGVNTTPNIENLHIHSNGPLYVLGGNSIFELFQSYVDEIHLWVVDNINATEDSPIKINMSEWAVKEYKRDSGWSYAHIISKEAIKEYNNSQFSYNKYDRP